MPSGEGQLLLFIWFLVQMRPSFIPKRGVCLGHDRTFVRLSPCNNVHIQCEQGQIFLYNVHVETLHLCLTLWPGAYHQMSGEGSPLIPKGDSAGHCSSDCSRAHIVELILPGGETIWLLWHVAQHTTGWGAVLSSGSSCASADMNSTSG